MTVRVAIDIGGTFTDATLIDEATGGVAIAKVSTTPGDPSVLHALRQILADRTDTPLGTVRDGFTKLH